jgi:DNA repair protein RadA/Sms
VGRCPSCAGWNTLVELAATQPSESAVPRSPFALLGVPGDRASRDAGCPVEGAAGPAVPTATGPVAIGEVDPGQSVAVPTGITELDRVLGGGLVPGSATLIGGEPGIGKSTLLLQALASMARRGLHCVLVSAEESPGQLRSRAVRIDAIDPRLWVVGESALPAIGGALAGVRADVVVVDSIQTIWDPAIDSPPGSLAQVRSCAHQLVSSAKGGGPAVVMVGHVTKEGGLAGPRVLEHLVDTVLSFEGDRHHGLRLLRALKHRFGPCGEVGLFEMTSGGLVNVDEPGRLFLADRHSGSPGSVVFASMEGRRPLIVEIQALVAPTSGPPRRSASGVDATRLAVLLAVLDRRAGIGLSQSEVYVSTVGGVRVDDPAADLAICMAVASAATQREVDPSSVATGEVGLSGQIRQVAHVAQRLAEAARLGFSRALVPGGTPAVAGIEVHAYDSLGATLDAELGSAAPPVPLRVVGSHA